MLKKGTPASPAMALASRFYRFRGAHQQNAFGNSAAQPGEFFRVFQKFDNFSQLLLGFIDTGHILEGHFLLLIGQKARPAFSEGHGFAAAALHLTHKKNPDTDKDNHGKPGDQNGHVPG
jgi:hypothetical protein